MERRRRERTVGPMSTRRIATVFAVALTAGAIGAPIASAESDEDIDIKGGAVEFVNYPDGTEGLWAHDEKRDGRGVRAYLTIHHRNAPVQTVWVTASNSGSDRDDTLHNQIAERTRVVLTACYVDDGRVTRCSRG